MSVLDSRTKVIHHLVDRKKHNSNSYTIANANVLFTDLYSKGTRRKLTKLITERERTFQKELEAGKTNEKHFI